VSPADRPIEPAGDDVSGIVVLLPELSGRLGPVCDRFNRGRPPHLSLLTPWVAPASLTEADLDAVAQLVKEFDRFELSFDRIDEFPGSPPILHLSPADSPELAALIEDITTVWPDYPPYGGAFDPVLDHLTLATTAGDAERAAIRAELGPLLPLHSPVAELAVVQIVDGTFSIRRRFHLGGRRKR